MNQDIRKNLKAYLDGELDAQCAEEVRAAIEEDASLRDEKDFMMSLSSSLRALRPRKEATHQMAEAAAKKLAKPRQWLLRSAWVGSGAGVILLAVLFAIPNIKSLEHAGQEAPGALTKSEPADSGGADASLPMSPEREAPSSFDKQSSAARNARSTYESATTQPPVVERNIIWTGDLIVRVDNLDAAKQEVRSAVAGWNGYIKSSTMNDSRSQTPRAEMVIRVPVSKFDEAMARFEKLGERVSANSDSQDVTEEVVDIEARLRTMKAQEETYRQLLAQAKTVGQVIEVQDRLSALRGDIESLEARAAKLKELSALSTIRLTLIQRPSSEEAEAPIGWARDAWAHAVNGLASALRSIATAVIFAFVWIPVWLPSSFLAFAIYRRLLKTRD